MIKFLGRNSVYLVIIIGTILTVNYYRPQTEYLPKGIILPISHDLPATKASQVKIYEFPPWKYQGLAYISVASHYLGPNKQRRVAVRNYAKQLAARIGANGLLITRFSTDAANGVSAPLAAYNLQAIAINTP